ncbi:hypothetical protein [Novipirellula artificiosorum]|uniref:Uncharacterized protein n=1 Tax=Novipirellula artificiosorum TaxID=2528016 RepID=A0A5C6CH05_9BACT|nr:hypothetical protein [Novipirellula artificiosorum]TWU22561.1 hypothetical protein Poly41_71260 [Novipirellula artificiosorum]
MTDIIARDLRTVGSVFNDSGTEFRTCRPHFISARAATTAGFFSKSEWHRRGFVVVDTGLAIFCVAKFWRTFHPEDEDVVLAYSLSNNYLVTNDRFDSELGLKSCWSVFPARATEPKRNPQSANGRKKTKLSNTNNQLSLSPLPSTSTSLSSSSTSSSSSYDGESPSVNKGNKGKHSVETLIPEKELRSRLIRDNAKQGTGVLVYFPETFDWDRHPQLQYLRSSFMWFAHTLHERRFVNTDGTVYGKDEYITIKSEFARNIDPKFRQLIMS